ncbi:Gfo/Idh/MocA family protein [Glycomyces terrestris]|uniref:Gfo/Idh/MocA family oxidoreductase n=1 Tax=Glycomyces terrestris TaxID=2493553 RepID=A0A426URF3_9ACTN|nr:Gfo/Idh/MocA family oxidoreductase [Glycomyces terrestris]RRR95625.1 gfo/Idh/MocA family oxidoreductase [Glycomyces terrestris]
MFSIGFVGAGQFAGAFAKLFDAHPGVSRVTATDLLPERAASLVGELGLAGVEDDFDAMLASDVDAVAVFTQRWTHGPLVVRALRAGKHVYSAVPMAFTVEEIGEIIEAVEETGLTYMMGETSHYHPVTVLARQKAAEGAFGRLFFAEGDYVHDMDHGFYAAYQYSGGEDWKRTASFPPLKYPTHAIGGVLGAWNTHAVSVSAIGVPDQRGDGVFDKAVSMFDNDFSNATALFETADGGSMRTNEFRRVGLAHWIPESRFTFYGTEGILEQNSRSTFWHERSGPLHDCTELVQPGWATGADDPVLANVDPALHDSFISGHAPIHDTSGLPVEFKGLGNGHMGSHQLLVHDFVTAVNERTMPSVNAWVAARYTLPGLVAHESALRGGERLRIEDFGDAPERV